MMAPLQKLNQYLLKQKLTIGVGLMLLLMTNWVENSYLENNEKLTLVHCGYVWHYRTGT